MKNFFKLLPAIFLSLAVGVTGCSKDDEPDDGNIPDDKTDSGTYGKLDGNLITTGGTRDVTYTSSVILGTVDFLKITGDHTYGIVYMEALKTADFDYDGKLVYGGHNGKTEDEEYECEHQQITSSTLDGKFEKQLVGLRPATVYYYRAYVRIGQNVNYSKVESFTTQDPSPEITLSTGAASDIYAVSATTSGVCNVGKLQDVNEKQEYGFIYSDAPQLNTPEKLSYDYYEQWLLNHFETEDEIERPKVVTTKENLNGRISCEINRLKPGVTYYYRTFFSWNGKYFYSPEVKSFKAKGADEITVGTGRPTDVTSNSARLNATLPFSSIGLSSVTGGFMISKVFSNSSEFDMNTAAPWSEREDSDADVFFVEKEISDKDFDFEITGLEAETTYYVRSYISLGVYDEEEMYIYGSMQSFTTEKKNSEVVTYSDGAYPWIQTSSDTWMSGNKGEGNTESTLTIKFEHEAGQMLSFDLEVSSESGYDGVVISVNGAASSLISGEQNLKRMFNCKADGSSTITVTYRKDGSGSYGEDCAIVRNIRLE